MARYGRRRKKKLSKEDIQQKITEAYFEFRRMAPSLGQYASTYLGKSIRVVAHHTTMTDGRLIYIRPPMELADQPLHQRALCGKRDAADVMECAACRVREHIIVALHHEIAHIAFGTFDQHKYGDYADFSHQVDKHLAMYSQHLGKLLSDLDYEEGTAAALTMSNAVHPHLGAIMMALEDQRINERSYERESGLRKRMKVLSKDILDKGVETEEGLVPWQTRTPDQQLMVGQIFFMDGFDLRAAGFDSDVVDVLENPFVKNILDGIVNKKNAMEVLLEVPKLLEFYRNAGYLTEHTEVRDQLADEQKEEFDEFFKMLNELFKSILSHGREMDDKSRSTGSKAQDEADEESVGGSTDEKPEDNEFFKVISSLQHLSRVPRMIDGVNVFDPGEGPYGSGHHAEPRIVPESLIGESVAKTRVILQANARAGKERDKRSGRIDARTLGKRAWNPNDGRLFKTNTRPDKRDYAVMMGFDMSGSTSSGIYVDGRQVSRLDMIKMSTAAMADTLDRVGIKNFRITGHTTGYSYDASGSKSTMDLYDIKRPQDKWDRNTRERLYGVRSGSTNYDGHTLQYYRLRLMEMKGTHRILFYFTDGAIPGSNYDEEVEVFKSELEECKKLGITVVGVGVFTDSPKEFGLPTVEVSSPADYPAVIEMLGNQIQV